MEPVSAAQYGIWMFALAATLGVAGTLVGIAVGIKKLFQVAPPDLQVITRKEAEQFATRAELLEVKGTIDRLQTYLQARMHELANQLAPIPTQVAILIKQQERLEEKLDQAGVRQERLLVMLEPRKSD
jgi:hypothetical protein